MLLALVLDTDTDRATPTASGSSVVDDAMLCLMFVLEGSEVRACACVVCIVACASVPSQCCLRDTPASHRSGSTRRGISSYEAHSNQT